MANVAAALAISIRMKGEHTYTTGFYYLCIHRKLNGSYITYNAGNGKVALQKSMDDANEKVSFSVGVKRASVKANKGAYRNTGGIW